MKHIEALPSKFRVISISGGEPTLSPMLKPFLKALGAYQRRSHRFDRIVLTTNGAKLMENLPFILAVVDHINISRHASTDEANNKVFQTSSVPSTDTIKTICALLSHTVVDVTLNCVICDNTKKKFCMEFIEYAKCVGATAVSFRKVASTTTLTPVENKLRKQYGTVSADSCPVCRGAVSKIEGLEVRWKGSVEEPSIHLGKVYEAVIHADGKLYSDWGRKKPLRIDSSSERRRVLQPVSFSSSCGSSGIPKC